MPLSFSEIHKLITQTYWTNPRYDQFTADVLNISLHFRSDIQLVAVECYALEVSKEILLGRWFGALVSDLPGQFVQLGPCLGYFFRCIDHIHSRLQWTPPPERSIFVNYIVLNQVQERKEIQWKKNNGTDKNDTDHRWKQLKTISHNRQRKNEQSYELFRTVKVSMSY